jgi:hypothetical protein
MKNMNPNACMSATGIARRYTANVHEAENFGILINEQYRQNYSSFGQSPAPHRRKAGSIFRSYTPILYLTNNRAFSEYFGVLPIRKVNNVIVTNFFK